MYNRINVLFIKSKNLRIKSLRDNIMSHHGMDTFFSGTDKDTLLEQGSERDVFVSLIVNNAGKYNAAITNKVEYNIERKVVGKGKGFGSEFDIVRNQNETVKCVEYSYFKEIITETNNLCFDLDTRINEIKKSKAKFSKPISYNDLSDYYSKGVKSHGLAYDKNDSKYYQEFIESANYTSSEANLFPEEIKQKKIKTKQNSNSDDSSIRMIAKYLTKMLIGGNIYAPDSTTNCKSFVGSICDNKKVNDGTAEDYLINIVDFVLGDATIQYVVENLGISIDTGVTGMLKLQNDIAEKMIDIIKNLSKTTKYEPLVNRLDLLIENITYYTSQGEEALCQYQD